MTSTSVGKGFFTITRYCFPNTLSIKHAEAPISRSASSKKIQYFWSNLNGNCKVSCMVEKHKVI